MSDTVATKTANVDEVVIVSSRWGGKRSVKGQTASIDEHLQQLDHVSLVRRGGYAWEPMVNNMQTERLSTTIDGMKIFYACTDKMDPVTSYVESGNLQSISLNSGLDGNPQATGNIGGSLDLRLRKVGFDADAYHQNLSAAYEANGHLQVYGTDVAISSSCVYTDFGAFYRHADDYQAGGGERLSFSQFQKVNAFANAGCKLGHSDVVEGTFIFDRATNVGYPALNMDVAKAEGIITSLTYKHLFKDASWETKVYYNHITHEMDDTHRPEVAIHMDMPGHSETAGLYSLLTVPYKRHSAALNYDLYYNRLFADMTMYAGEAKPMYMVTWPDVGTLCTGLALTDDITLSQRQQLRLSAKVAVQQQRLNDEEGWHALSVFFPGMNDRYHQTTARIAVNDHFSFPCFQFAVGAGWGSRAPTVTEAYGYYLNNTFDQYDYMGNPTLKNESAIELNVKADFSFFNSHFSIGVDANAFFFSNYIIGHVEPRLSAMTLGAKGVKVYGNQDHATIANVSMKASWRQEVPGDGELKWNASLTYSLGRDTDGDALPLIAPLTYVSDLTIGRDCWLARLELRGNARQTKYGEKYGETAAQAWAVVGLSAQYVFGLATLRLGVENLFDKRYATYADWNHIPQKGRNIFASLSFDI
ncbi:MAG: TonB-dependent receptor [Prevotella sp.]|nr:TonB-dependent receptor [Prevotella sp.]